LTGGKNRGLILQQSTTGKKTESILMIPKILKRFPRSSFFESLATAALLGFAMRASAQSCATPPSGLLSWWRGENTAADFFGLNNGTVQSGVVFTNGEVGRAFFFNGSSAAVDLGPATNLELQNFTIEAWVKRASPSVVSFDTSGDGVIFGFGEGGYALVIDGSGTPFLNQIGDGSAPATAQLTDINWHHLAVTTSGGTVIIYIDGVAAGGGFLNPGYVFTSDAGIGGRIDAAANFFYGAIDEVSVYSRALEASEVQSIYAAGSAGKCTSLSISSQPTNEVGVLGRTNSFSVSVFGLPPLTYQWLFNTNPIPDATNSVLTLSDIQFTNAGTYAVAVSNNSGQVLSSNAVLTVVTPVSITSPPTNFSATLGAPASFSVSAAGTAPLGYQWAFDGANIPNATNSSYVVASVAFPNFGLYSVMVTNPWSSATASAVLALNPQIMVNGQLGTNFVFTNVPSVQVQVSSLFTNATIFYTLDGSAPGLSSTPYSGPFAATESAIIRAIAYDQSFNSSTSLPVNVAFVQYCLPPPVGLLSWWPANGSAVDFVGTNNGVPINNASYGAGEAGEAFLLTNKMAAFDVGYATNLQIQNFTIEAWVRRKSASVLTVDPSYVDGAIFSYGANGYGFEISHGSTLVLTKLDTSGVLSTGTVTGTNFHHVAVTKSNSVVNFYIDGVNAGQSSYNPGFVFHTPAAIGACGDFLQNSFYGLVDELAIYNRALSASEIQAIYQAGSGGKCESLTILAQPTNEIGLVGATNTFSVLASGMPPLSYQWIFNSASITNATNASLTITNVQPDNGGTYAVIVSGDSTEASSSNAVLTVVTPVSISSGPSNVAATLGAPATFSVNVSGTQPFNYQWAFDGAKIPNATNSSYVISAVAFSNIGTYSVVVTNSLTSAAGAAILAFNPQITVNGQLGTNFAFTNVPSALVQISSFFSNATIFYTLDGSPPGLSSTSYNGPFALTQSAIVRAIAYDQSFNSSTDFPVDIAFVQFCLPPPAGLLSWWPANGSAIDFTGANNGVPINNASYGAGESGEAFLFTNQMAAVDVGYATNLQLQNFTIEAWIRRKSASVLTVDPNDTDGAIFSYGANGYGFEVSQSSTLVLTALDSSGVLSTGTVTGTNFHHVAVTKTNSVVIFYIDGVNAGQSSYDPGFIFDTPASIGACGDLKQNSFYGLIDELAVYDRALSASEIQAIYQAGSGGKCESLSIAAQPTNEIGLVGASNTFNVVAYGLPPLSYQWIFNSAAITNATNASLIIANVQPVNGGTYSVIVSGDSSEVFSSNAVLTVVTPVSISSGPSNIAATLGAPATFSVSVSGTQPFSYQWAFDDTNIPNATNFNYVLSNVTFSNIGSYSVMVSNPWSSATASALLAFNPQITVNGQLGTNFGFTNVPSAEVQISSLFSNATIFYTLDGSIPGVASTPYNGAFAVTQPVMLQAVAYDQSFNAAFSFPVDINVLRSNSLAIINPGGGTVTLNPPGGIYLNNQIVQVTATPTNGWTFLQWSGSVSSSSPVIEVSMLTNQNLQAVFGTPIAFSPVQNGSFHLNPFLPAFPYGSQIAISALPATGYFLGLWGGSASGVTNPYVMNITSPNPTISALFAALPAGKFSLVVIPNGNGLVSINPAGNSFTSNSTVSITATPAGTNVFCFWTGSVTTSNNPLNNLVIRSNNVITANFTGGAYPVQFSAPVKTATNIEFSLEGAPFQAYDIDVSSNLLDWILFATATNTDGSISISDVNSNSPQKFYRAVLH